jgi:ribosomal protein S18 acetylase RimI-like enzyme
MNNNLFFKLKENLNNNDFIDINDLKNICFVHDNTSLKIEIDYKLSNSGKNSDKTNSINEFMLYDDNKLIGYAGICDFGGEEIEVNGMVHPDYRRKRIFTRLFSLVKDEFKRRENKAMLLLSDNNSVGGIEFIKNITDDFSHSEYDMNLDMDASQNVSFNNLIFRKAVIADIDKIKEANFEFFSDNDIKEISSGITYLLEADNILIGKVRLEIIDNIGGIYGLEVLPDYRGKGYGRELLILSIKKLKESNVKIINLQVETNNKNALNLYKSCGFKENYTMDYYRLNKSL